MAAASAAMMKPAAAQDTGYKDTTPWPGVVAYDGTISHPGFKIVSCSTSSAAGIEDCRSPDDESMVCHITEGELRIEQEGRHCGQEEFCLDLRQRYE